jgi:glycosidase
MKHKLLLPLAALLLVAAISCKTTTNEVKNRLSSETPMPEWAKDAVIYEVNLRQYTNEGTIAAFETHLPRLKELGVDILWFMPVHPIGEKNRKGGLGSYYSVKDYTAINPEFGTMDDFKNMVNKAHELGFKVIIDWVANHTAWDHAWVNTNPDYYAKDSTGNMYGPYDWTDVAQLDFSNQQLRADMIDALKFWVAEANIDGYRCDVAGKVPVDFWEAATKELNNIKPVFMLAEEEDEEA